MCAEKQDQKRLKTFWPFCKGVIDWKINIKGTAVLKEGALRLSSSLLQVDFLATRVTTVDKLCELQEKLCFFHNSLHPSPAYIAVSDLQSSHRNASVQSLLLAGSFLYNQ